MIKVTDSNLIYEKITEKLMNLVDEHVKIHFLHVFRNGNDQNAKNTMYNGYLSSIR